MKGRLLLILTLLITLSYSFSVSIIYYIFKNGYYSYSRSGDSSFIDIKFFYLNPYSDVVKIGFEDSPSKDDYNEPVLKCTMLDWCNIKCSVIIWDAAYKSCVTLTITHPVTGSKVSKTFCKDKGWTQYYTFCNVNQWNNYCYYADYYFSHKSNINNAKGYLWSAMNYLTYARDDAVTYYYTFVAKLSNTKSWTNNIPINEAKESALSYLSLHNFNLQSISLKVEMYKNEIGYEKDILENVDKTLFGLVVLRLGGLESVPEYYLNFVNSLKTDYQEINKTINEVKKYTNNIEEVLNQIR